ncbi:MAG: UDP-glucose 4-epimerase GalE [Pigmentiphaga sp.]|nr:UDP-glucose 4-epimerase GalE [Pigmentiphaga sp.]
MAVSHTLLVTGGAGFIGSHTLVELLAAGFDVVVFDNFQQGSREALRRVQALSGRSFPCVEGDVRDAAALDRLFARQAELGAPIDAVVHFAALKAVADSVARPLAYYDNNVQGTLALLAAMRRAGVSRLVFSSSATVYGEPQALPYDESHPIAPTNPYGHTKAMVERILRDLCMAEPDFSAVTLRYFNPIGAHPSGRIGEDPHGAPDNLFPYLTRVAIGQLPELRVFGTDYATADGTGVRDYIHVVDLAQGHVAALRHALSGPGFTAVNLGTGHGTSVLELLAAFAAATGVAVPWRPAPRRAGDIAAAWADPRLAERLLGWRASRDIAAMCADGWRWQTRHPDGYAASGAGSGNSAGKP